MVLIFGKNIISIKKGIVPPENIIDLLMLKKISVYLFFSWLLVLNIGPMAKIINQIYFHASAITIILPLFFIFQKIYKEKSLRVYDKYLIMFILISLISCLVNFHGIPGNIKRVIWSSIYVFFVFSDNDLSEVLEGIKRFFLISVFILSLISIGMFVVQYQKEFILNDWPVKIGFVENRLFGTYKYLNCGVILSIICFYLCIQNIINMKNEIFSLINIVVQLIYISLSNSRTCQASLTVSFAFFCFIFFYKKLLLNTKKNKSEILFISLLISVLCSFAITILLKCISYVLIEGTNALNFYYNIGKSNHISLDRLDITYSHEYSNGRFAIWLNALEIFKSNWILGVSPGNILNYANKYFPHEIIAMKKYDSMHNTLIDIMTSIGFIGTLPCIVFFVKYVIMITKFYIHKYRINCDIIKKNLELDVLLTSIISVLVAGAFGSEIVFVNNLETFLFWLFLSEVRRKIEKENYEIRM